MPKKNKLELSELIVKSFTTGKEIIQIQGGGTPMCDLSARPNCNKN